MGAFSPAIGMSPSHRALLTSSPRFKCRHDQTGFSLLETLVALVILSLALGVLYQGTSGATRNAMVSSQYSVATALAESVLDDFATSVIAGGSAQGVFEEFTWRAVAVPELPPDGQLDAAQGLASELNRIVVLVTWEGIGQAREVRLETLVDVPNEPPA